jgi:uncharacterized repeat protein (TIGR04076 family)
MSKVKVTVVKKMDLRDIFGGKPPAKINQSLIKPQCDQFEEGQEFIMDLKCPADFCSWAYADIQRDIVHVLMGGDYPWLEEKGAAISCCTDGLRPVIFKIERVEI